MSHPYRGDEEQDFPYNRSHQYDLSHSPYQPYPSQLLASYNNPNADVSGSLNPPYPSSQTLYAQPPQHALSGHVPHYGHQYGHARYSGSPACFPAQDMSLDGEIESQESCNENSMASEPVVPPLEGFPDVREFDQLMKTYVDDLSVKKQDKALIHAIRARNIRTVLLDPKDTAIESAQFRFWAKKMFSLEPSDARSPGSKKSLICHERKPVAIREKLFKILTRAHQQCQHGGRDKTSTQVRRTYSWVPKELISRFVKLCPTCQVRRGASRGSPPPGSLRNSPRIESDASSQSMVSPPDSRRASVATRQSMGGMSRADHPHTYGYSWVNTQQNIPGQLSPNMPPVSTGWGQLPRSISTGITGGIAAIPMPSNNIDYGTSYDESHGISGPPHY